MTRKEIIQFSGYHILIGMMIIGNLLVVGFMLRWHNGQRFAQEKRAAAVFTETLRKERELKEEIRKLEGAKTWNDTAYAQKNPWSKGGDSDE